MTLMTAVKPKQTEEVYSEKDLTEISRIIRLTHSTYSERLLETDFNLHEAQRSINRATHERHRLERHLERIEEFCKKNNISLNNTEQE